MSFLFTTSSTQAIAVPALTTCTDLATHKQIVLTLGRATCRSQQAPAMWHLQLSDTDSHVGTAFASLLICSDLHATSLAFQLIRSTCPKYQKSTFYWRAISPPKAPNISNSLASSYNTAILTIGAESATTDSPVVYYLINNLATGVTTKISKTSLGILNKIYISDLAPLSQYTFSISAVNIDGASSTSSSSDMVTTGSIPISLQAPAFTLSSSSFSTVVGNSLHGFTISSTGGAVDSYSISPAISTTPGLSFNSSTGLISGTPTTAASAAVYTIIATNNTASSRQTFNLTVNAALAAPAFSLSSVSESVATGAALTGYAISSTGGAIASYSISPSISTTPGLSFSGSTGLISGTPSTMASAQAYTIRATNATASTNQTFTLTVITSGYSIGSVGPGGGTVFYYNAVGFNCGPTFSATCNYLEVAPNTWSGGIIDPNYIWSVVANQTIAVTGIPADAVQNISSAAIGLGYKNSLAIIAQGNDNTTAAGAARAYTGGSKNDWYLPSAAELNQLCKWARGNAWVSDATACSTTGTLTDGGFASSTYWSSSEIGDGGNAYAQRFDSGSRAGQWRQYPKVNNPFVRPIRTF